MDRPFVYINMAMTVDGKITSALREYPRFTSTSDRKHMDRLRAEADAIAVGAGTMRADDPPLFVRDEEMRAYRRSLGKPEGLLNVLISASLSIDASSRFFHGSSCGHVIATVEEAPAERVAELERRAEVWKLGRRRVDLTELLRRLHRRGVERLLVEGGGKLNWGLIRAGLADELNVTIAPALLGGEAAPTLLEGDGLKMSEQLRLRLVDVRRDGDELYCRYRMVR